LEGTSENVWWLAVNLAMPHYFGNSSSIQIWCQLQLA